MVKDHYVEFKFSTPRSPFFSPRASIKNKVFFFAGSFGIILGLVSGVIYLPQLNGFVGLAIIGGCLGIGLPLIYYYGKGGHDPREMVDALKDIEQRIKDAIAKGETPAKEGIKGHEAPSPASPAPEKIKQSTEIPKPRKSEKAPVKGVKRYEPPLPIPFD